MKNKERTRMYFDYNIFESISKELIYFFENDVDIFYSVAHVEEYYKAVQNINLSDINNINAADALRNTIIKLTKKGVILKPDKRIKAKSETFDECLKIVSNFDTRKEVNHNAGVLLDLKKESTKNLYKKDISAINNTNLDEKTIWNRPEVKDELAKFNDYYNDYLKNIRTYLNNYILQGYRLKNIELPKEFDLKKECFNKEDNFHLIQVVFEFLNNILEYCGYAVDKDKRKTISGIHDVSHMIYATYCHYLVSNDERFSKRAKAIYYYTGINTKVIRFNEYFKLIDVFYEYDSVQAVKHKVSGHGEKV